MKSQIRSKRQENIKISDYYALRLKALWAGFNSEHISFKLLCLYFFLEYVRPQDLIPGLDIIPWSQGTLLLTLLTVFSDNSIKWVSNIENKLLVIFSLLILLSSIFAFAPSYAWGNRNLMISWILVYFLVINVVNSEKRLILFILCYLLFNLKMSQHGAIEWARRGFSFADYGLIGAPGFFRNSGEFAIQMLIYSPLATAYVMSFKEYWGRYKKWFLYAAAATGYMSVIGASSRGAQLGLLAICIWWVLKLEGGVKALIALAIVSTVLFNLLPEEQMQRFSEMGTDRSSIQRMAYWEYGLELIKEHPLLGVGYHNWIPYLTYDRPEGLGPEGKIQVAHNIYIQVGSEIGIPALFCFLLMVLILFVMNARTRAMARNMDNRLLFYMAYALDAGLIGYLVAGTFVTVFYYPFFWVQMAMIVMVNTIAKRQQVLVNKPLESTVVSTTQRNRTSNS